MESTGGPLPALEYVISKMPDWSPWMGKNLLMAAIPVGLALLLFRGERPRTPLWWVGFVTFIVFLPNAPYVLADSRWLRGPWLNAWYQDRWRFLTVLPVWGLYFGLGFLAFAVCVRKAQGYLAANWAPWVGRAAAVALCFLSAIGIYLGRAALNSWSLITEPRQVLGVLTGPASVGTILRIGLAFAALLAIYMMCVGVMSRYRRLAEVEPEAISAARTGLQGDPKSTTPTTNRPSSIASTV